MSEKTTRSVLLYVETCCVDHGGLLEGQRMNKDDMDALEAAQKRGLLTWGRIPASLLNFGSGSRRPTHWAQLTVDGWTIIHCYRRERATQRGPWASAVFAEVEAREKGDG